MKTQGKQQGAVLVVTLVMLVVALMLGLSSFQSSRLEESMAGNQRSASVALMASEYGASEAWSEILDISLGNTLETNFINALDAAVDLNSSKKILGGDSSHPNVYYEISVLTNPGLDVPVNVVGEVYSDAQKTELVASRNIQFLARLNGLGAGNLSPFNVPATLENYNGIRSQADLEGEEDEVDGTQNPAISAASREDARDIVMDIISANSIPAEENSKYTFVPNDPNDGTDYNAGVDGTYYATPTVVDGVYTGDYSDCNSGNNRMCNYKGGVSTIPKDNILSDANLFHEFVSAIFSDAYLDAGSESLSSNMSGFNIISKGDHLSVEGGYSPVRYVNGEELPDGSFCGSDICFPARETFSGGGSSAGDGVLVIDGDVEFNGDPEFQGIILVLGNYAVSGGGGGDMEGAIIAAPYSCHQANECDFDSVTIDVSGGGGNDYRHVKSILDNAWAILGGNAPNAARMWLEGNNPGGQFTYMAYGWRELTEN